MASRAVAAKHKAIVGAPEPSEVAMVEVSRCRFVGGHGCEGNQSRRRGNGIRRVDSLLGSLRAASKSGYM